ncbi:MAG: choice-of-anchor J domain-containing protein [Bacteroidota bacterium]
MKLIFTVLLFLPLAGMSQTVILNEDFQSGFPVTWTLYNDNNQPHENVSEYTEAWIVVADPENTTDSVASATSYFETPDEADRWMVSPAITLGAFGNYISWQAKSHDPSYPEDYKVMISTSPGLETFTDTVAVIFEENYLWQTYDMNLSDLGYDNQTVYIAFNLRTDDGFKLYIDDIAVRKEDPVSVAEKEFAAFELYPNPCTTELTVKGKEEITQTEVFDALGKKVLTTVKSTAVNTSGLVPGIYLLKVYTVSGVSTQRFSVR